MASSKLPLVLVVILGCCAIHTLANTCPLEYPIESCPAEGDREVDQYCCYSPEEGYHCCADTLPTWAIVLICIGVVAVLVIVGCLICCCCGFCSCITSCCRKVI
ncbi:uncharacterized protein LOC100368010 [Saccoglossus kowalevskii]|uniref:Uncharacterized protein LOC100368010 n=1 Tax=Saccoglossus kowalevskii TaxID=10224 RepID=A0ABM0H1A0_SACKO|nr:PREDICTED: uncharacterized protein LOC100368010 [Saccoglossus kowalevskii]